MEFLSTHNKVSTQVYPKKIAKRPTLSQCFLLRNFIRVSDSFVSFIYTFRYITAESQQYDYVLNDCDLIKKGQQNPITSYLLLVDVPTTYVVTAKTRLC